MDIYNSNDSSRVVRPRVASNNQEGGFIKRSFQFDKLSTWLLSVLVVGLPLIFLPSAWVPFQSLKMILIGITVVLATLFWIISRLREENISVPVNKVCYSAIALVVVYILATIFSGNSFTSMFGEGFAPDSTLFIFFGLAIFALIASIFQKPAKAAGITIGILVSVLLIALFHVIHHLLRLGGVSLPDMGFFFNLTDNTIGKWGDLMTFMTLGLLISLSAIFSLKLEGYFKIMVYATAILSAIMMIIGEAFIPWHLLAVVAVALLVYGYVRRNEFELPKMASIASWILIVICGIFIFFGSSTGPLGMKITDSVLRKSNASYIEIRQAWQNTIDVMKGTYSTSPFLGVGPARYNSAWEKYKPDTFNYLPYWNTSFLLGVGLIPTFFATLGLLGTLAWLAFLYFVFSAGIKNLFNVKEHDKGFVVLSATVGSVYLTIINFVYAPSIVITILWFVFLGLMIAHAVRDGELKVLNVQTKDSPRAGFLTVAVLVLVLIVTLSGGYVMSKRVVASVLYQKGIQVASIEGDLEKSRQFISSAISLNNDDEFYRALTELDVIRLSNFINSNPNEDAMRTEVPPLISTAVSSAQGAIATDNTDYRNYISLGEVYRSLVPIQNAYESAVLAYDQAITLNPKNPLPRLLRGRLELSVEDTEKARMYITEALNLKPNYNDAVFTLSQMEIDSNNISQAIRNIEGLSILSPNDAVVFFQLGLLRYGSDDIDGAVNAFERAVILDNTFANARYFLGVSYYRDGRRADAVTQFEILNQIVPNNEEVQFILSNLKAGKSPFADAQPPIDENPEEREDLPVEEE